jgi:hypothetical protein
MSNETLEHAESCTGVGFSEKGALRRAAKAHEGSSWGILDCSVEDITVWVRSRTELHMLWRKFNRPSFEDNSFGTWYRPRHASGVCTDLLEVLYEGKHTGMRKLFSEAFSGPIVKKSKQPSALQAEFTGK